jgi:hypothetical protein
MDSNHRFRVAQTVKPSWEAGLVSRKRERICWGTEGSNPSPSSGESAANLRRGSFGAVVTDPCLLCVLFRAGLRQRRQARTSPC